MEGQELCDAARKGDLARLRAILATGVDVNVRDSRGWTALENAAYYGRTACLEALLAAGALAHHPESLYWGALARHPESLFCSSLRGHEACVRALTAAGTDVNRANRNGRTYFSCFLEFGYRRSLKILLRAGADVHTGDAKRRNNDAWNLVDAIRKVGGWPQYVTRRRATVASVVKKAVTHDALPDAINLEIATFVEPPGGY